MKIFTLLYNNYEVIRASLRQLRDTNTLNLPIHALDNNYPDLTKKQVAALVKEFGLVIQDKERINRGLAGGYNRLIELNQDTRYAILFDCDSWPITRGWDEALINVIQHPTVAYLSLMFDTAKREMMERGFTPWRHDSGEVVWRPHQACMQSVSCADLIYLRQIGGMREPRPLYGGLEGEMFKNWTNEHQIGYIDGVYEIKHPIASDPQYTAFKWAYAHENYQGTFEQWKESQS